MKEWRILPTEDKFLDLTTEQLEFMYHQYLIDNPPKEDNKFRDSDYDKEELESEYGSEDREEGRLPLSDYEHFEDPDFEEEWNKIDEDDEILNKDNIGENPSEQNFGVNGEEALHDEEDNINPSELDDWEEV